MIKKTDSNYGRYMRTYFVGDDIIYRCSQKEADSQEVNSQKEANSQEETTPQEEAKSQEEANS